MAEKAFGLFDCCLEDSQPKCNSAVHRDDISSEWQRWGIKAERIDQALSPAEAYEHLYDIQSPIEVGLRFSGLGGAHAILLVGIVLNDDAYWAIVLDPREGRKFIRYSELLSAYSRGVWTWTWKLSK
jgi:hypothetical protein